MNQLHLHLHGTTKTLAALVLVIAVTFASSAHSKPRVYELTLPALNPDLPPIATENHPLLFDRLVAAFGQDYLAHATDNLDRSLCDGMGIYYLRRELQALVDMWRATGEIAYLDCAKSLTLQAIDEAIVNRRPLIWHGQPRGDWPCFYLDTVVAETGGHSQLCDFQGSVGFMMVAGVLQKTGDPAWRGIADFVERQVVEKWFYYKPSITPWHMQNSKSFENLLAILNSGRDVREHFACLCLDFHKLGYRSYLYRIWAQRLIGLYLTIRDDPNQPAPYLEETSNLIPNNWGLLPRTTEEGHVWLWIPNYDANRPLEAADTSHANRTAWLAARAHSDNLVDKRVIDGLINTFKFRVWAPEKGPFYFNNYTDGSDGELNGLASGRGGNIWFGWHRLAAFDKELEDLFLSIAYDLTNGGFNLPYGAQNNVMQNAPICLEAWGTRLLSVKGQPDCFP